MQLRLIVHQNLVNVAYELVIGNLQLANINNQHSVFDIRESKVAGMVDRIINQSVIVDARQAIVNARTIALSALITAWIAGPILSASQYCNIAVIHLAFSSINFVFAQIHDIVVLL